MRKGIYQSDNGTWYIHTKKRGKNITIRGYKSRQDAEKDFDFAIEKWLKQHQYSPIKNSYLNVVNEYIEYRRKILRAESLRKDITQFKYFYEIFSHDTITNVFEPLRIKLIYSQIIKDTTITSKKKNRMFIVFRNFAEYCYKTNRIEKGAYDNVLLTFLPLKDAKQVVKVRRYIPISHFKALISEINRVNDKIFVLIISVLYFGGLRISECLGLLGEDIDLTNKKIKVKRQLLTNGKLTTTLKTTNSYREVPMNNELYNLFKNFELIENNRVFNISHTHLKRKLAYYENQANIPNYSCHEFRHSFCTNLAKKITNISEVSYCAKVSGHTVSMYLDTYVKSLESEMVDKFF